METIFLVGLCILLFGLISGRIEGSILTPPMIFVGFGLLAGRWGLNLLPAGLETSVIDILATMTLVLVLFTDASRIDLSRLRREHSLPVRLLGIGLPLTICLGFVAALLLIDGIGIWEAALLAAILAPTDAALGQTVVTNAKVPVRIRQALNVESGLNDGLALPVVLMFLSLASGETGKPATDWLQFAALQVTLGPLVGVAVGLIGGQLVLWGKHSGWMNQSFQDLSPLGLSMLAYASAEQVGGNGFIAAFTAGLVLGNTARSICKSIYEFAEAEGQLLTLLVFMVFGAIMLPNALSSFQPIHLLYATASLTLIRMVPVAISLLGMRLRKPTWLFLAWFGPRGIASILYALLLLEASEVPHGEMLLSVIATTVLLSIVLHGLTAMPGVNWYSRFVLTADSGSPEHVAVSELPTRRLGTARENAKGVHEDEQAVEPIKWDVGFERMPSIRFSAEDDTVEIVNFRNFRFEKDGSHHSNWETRSFDLKQTCRVDFILVPFSDREHLAHTMVSFGFSNGEFITISVEARRRLGQPYSITRGLFGAYPLTYVIADERDCVGLRTEVRQDTVHLYPSVADPEQAREFLVRMLKRAQKLGLSPERYNTLSNNCLTNLRDHVNEVWPGRIRWNWRLLLSGHAGYLAFELGLLGAGDSFESLSSKAKINDLAKGNLQRDDFSNRIRNNWENST